IESTKDMNPFDLFQAAVYYLENGKDLKQAMTWITKAEESIKDAYWLQYQKARIQQGLGDKKGALATAKASLENAKAADDLSFQKMKQALIAARQLAVNRRLLPFIVAIGYPPARSVTP